MRDRKIQPTPERVAKMLDAQRARLARAEQEATDARETIAVLERTARELES